MKKLFGLLLCSVFMLAGCNEAKAEKKEAPAPQPAAAAKTRTQIIAAKNLQVVFISCRSCSRNLHPRIKR